MLDKYIFFVAIIFKKATKNIYKGGCPNRKGFFWCVEKAKKYEVILLYYGKETPLFIRWDEQKYPYFDRGTLVDYLTTRKCRCKKKALTEQKRESYVIIT